MERKAGVLECAFVLIFNFDRADLAEAVGGVMAAGVGCS